MAKKKTNSNVKVEIHGRRIMANQDGIWVACKFEYDSQDGRGVVWQRARGSGSSNTLEKTLLHFEKMGYTIVDWDESV